MPYKDIEKKRAYERKYLQRPDVKKKRKAGYKSWREINKEHLAIREADRRLNKRGQCLIANARTRSRRKSIEFDLDSYQKEIQERIDGGVCEITGCEFDLSPGRNWNSPSLDRVDPKKGYVYSNIRVVCHAMNVAMAQQEADGIPRYVTYDCLRFDDSFLTKEQLERLARNERLISDLEGPGSAA